MTGTSTDQATTVNTAEEAYQSIREYVEGIATEDMLRPNRVGMWSGRDLVLHMAVWEREGTRMLRELAAGDTPATLPEGFDIDTFNQQAVAAFGDLSLPVALDIWADAHREFIDTYRELGIDAERILIGGTRYHYRLHYPDFRHVKPFRPLDATDREDLLAEMDAAQAKLLALIDTLPEDRLLQQETVGVWSGKDLIAHLGHWLEAAARLTRELEQDRPGKWPGEDGSNINEWNEARVAGVRDLSLAEVRAFQQHAFDELRELIATSPYATRSAGIGATSFHYGLHEEDFRTLA